MKLGLPGWTTINWYSLDVQTMWPFNPAVLYFVIGQRWRHPALTIALIGDDASFSSSFVGFGITLFCAWHARTARVASLL